MGWAVFIFGFVVTIPVGWFLFASTKGDRFLCAMGLVLLAPTIWSGGLGLKLGPCDTPTCVTHTQQDLLIFAVAALVILIAAFVVIAMRHAVPGAALITLSCVLNMVAAWKIDKVMTIMFAILAVSTVLYLALSLLPNRPEPAV